MHKLQNSQPIINVEIPNYTLYVLIYLISKCLDWSTVITTLHYITVNGVCIYIYYTELYSKKYFGSSSVSNFCMCMEFLLPNSNVNSSHSLNQRHCLHIFAILSLHLTCSTMSLVLFPNVDVDSFLI